MTTRGRPLGIALALPSVAHVLQARMQLQVLVQIPLLAVAGYLLGAALPAGWKEGVDP